MSILVGRWDCPACGAKGIKGPLTRCSACGSARPENVQFYLPQDAERLQDAEAIRKAKSGADWVCTHCQSHNKAWEQACRGCGSHRDEAAEGDFQLPQRELPKQPPPTPSATPVQSRRKWYVGGGVIALLVVLLFVALGWEQNHTVTVLEHRWERQVAVEHYQEVEEEGWELPSEARLIDSYRAVHHTERQLKGYETRTRTVRVKVGEERYVAGTRDLGNGNFEEIYKTRPVYEERQEKYEEPVYENVPVYRTKYRYAIFRWKTEPPLRAAGTGRAASWPQLPADRDRQTWRTGKKKARYILVVQEENGERHKEEVSETFWQNAEDGMLLKAKKGALTDDYRGLVKE